MDNGDETHDQVCEDCNEHLVVGGAHYDGNGDGFCDKCKAATTQLLIATIPLTLPMTANLNGEVAVADNAEIRNLSSTQAIKVTDVRVSVFSGWTLVDGDTVFTEADRGAQQLAMGFRGTPVAADGSMDMTQSDWSIEANGRLPLNMEVSIPAQNHGASQFTMGKVTFVLDWEESSDDPEPPIEEQPTIYNKDRLDSVLKYAKTITVTKGNPADGIDISEKQDRTVLATIDENADGYVYLNNAYLISANKMFFGCNDLVSLDMTNFDTSRITNMDYMFGGCIALASLDVSNFDTSNVTSMGAMFSNCTTLPSLDLSSFDTSKVAVTNHMFWACFGLRSLDLSGFDTSSLEDMGYMFLYCSGLKSLDISGFDTSNVTNMEGVFSGCYNLSNFDLSGFNTSNVTNMSWMFEECYGLTILDISSFDIGNVTTMEGMFSFAYNSYLTTLYVKDATAKTKLSNYIPSSCTIIIGSPA